MTLGVNVDLRAVLYHRGEYRYLEEKLFNKHEHIFAGQATWERYCWVYFLSFQVTLILALIRTLILSSASSFPHSPSHSHTHSHFQSLERTLNALFSIGNGVD